MNDSKKNDMELKEIEEIGKMSQERFQSQKEHYEFLMYQLQSHMIEIDDRKTNIPHPTAWITVDKNEFEDPSRL